MQIVLELLHSGHDEFTFADHLFHVKFFFVFFFIISVNLFVRHDYGRYLLVFFHATFNRGLRLFLVVLAESLCFFHFLGFFDASVGDASLSKDLVGV